jgi:chromosome segregation ATPase
MYFVVVATRSPAAIPKPVRVSLFTDTADSELKRSETNAAEALRLDRILGEHDAVLERQTGHIHHLETLLAEHQRVIAQRDSEFAAVNTAFAEVNAALASTSAALNSTSEALAARAAEVAERDGQLAECARSIDSLQTRVSALEGALKALSERLAAREQVILYRESWRWWVRIPFLPIKRLIDSRTARR